MIAPDTAILEQSHVVDASQFAKVPEALVSLNRWVVWSMEERDGKQTKIPYQTSGVRADSTDAITWTTYAEALDAYLSHPTRFDGIGIVLGDGICGVDLDDCIVDGQILSYAQQIINDFNCYTEISPSGTGVKLFFLADALPPTQPTDGSPAGRRAFSPTKERAGKIEMYSEDRYFTVTGKQISEGLKVERRNEQFRALYDQLCVPKRRTTRAPEPASLDDTAIIDKLKSAKNGAKFTRLFSGDTSDYSGDESNADQAICCMLAFYTRDEHQIDRIVRASGLYRDKWEREDYRARTIAKALELVTEQYKPKGRAKTQPPRTAFMLADGSEVTTGATPSGSAEQFELTELGMAERVLSEHGEKFRYVAARRKFLVFDGRRWTWDEDGRMNRLAISTIRRTKRFAASIQGEISKALWKHAISLETSAKVKAILELVSKLEGVTVSMDMLDTDPWLFNVRNGTIDLRTAELKPHDSNQLITRLADVVFDRDADCPRFKQFLDRIFENNSELIQFVRRAGGYSLTGLTGERVYFTGFGTGRNGKSTLMNAWAEIMGDYTTAIRAETLMMQREGAIRNDLAKLAGIRFVVASESDEGRRLAEAQVKQMTGGTDSITARFLYGEEFSFYPQFKIWLSTNHRPVVRGTDAAMWDRIRLIPFNVRIPDDECDRTLPDKLREEYSGILTWLVAGCIDWQQRKSLAAPAIVTEATADYRSEMDVIGEFLTECCIMGEGCKAEATPLFERYKIWAAVNNETAVSQKRFGMQLTERRFLSGRGSSSGRKCWVGIGLKSDLPEPSEPSEPSL